MQCIEIIKDAIIRIMNTYKIRQNTLYEVSKKLLKTSGVYLMYDVEGTVLYVGKSINLRRRVGSYFLLGTPHSKKITKMIRLIAYFNVFYTDTELDALLLECKFIKRYKPRYNTLLTKEHRYFYLDFYNKPIYAMKISNHNRQEPDIRLGPFTNYRLAMHGINYIKKEYPYLVCGFLQKDAVNSCYAYQFKKCHGHCLFLGQDMALLVDDILINNTLLIKKMHRQMENFVENLEFEKAHEALKAIQGIKYLTIINKRLLEAYEPVAYIGILPLADNLIVKVYVIYEGRILWTTKGYRGLIKSIVAFIKESLTIFPQPQRKMITIEEVDELLIIQNHFSKMLLLEKV